MRLSTQPKVRDPSENKTNAVSLSKHPNRLQLFLTAIFGVRFAPSKCGAQR